MPTSITCFTTICKEWNRERIRDLQASGYNVIVLWENENKAITGGAIRQDIIKDGKQMDRDGTSSNRKGSQTPELKEPSGRDYERNRPCRTVGPINDSLHRSIHS